MPRLAADFLVGLLGRMEEPDQGVRRGRGRPPHVWFRLRYSGLAGISHRCSGAMHAYNTAPMLMWTPAFDSVSQARKSVETSLDAADTSVRATSVGGL